MRWWRGLRDVEHVIIWNLIVFVKRPGFVGKICPVDRSTILLVYHIERWSAMMETIGDQLEEFGHFPERRQQYTLNTGTRADGRFDILLNDVLDFIFLIMNCCFEFASFCIELSKLTELVLEDLVDITTWFRSYNRQAKGSGRGDPGIQQTDVLWF